MAGWAAGVLGTFLVAVMVDTRTIFATRVNLVDVLVNSCPVDDLSGPTSCTLHALMGLVKQGQDIFSDGGGNHEATTT